VRIDKLIDRVHSMKMPAVALTDWANLYGVLYFMKAAKGRSEGAVKPIYGAEIGVVFPQGGSQLRHLVFLAENNIGFKNLSTLVTLSHTEYGYSQELGLQPKLPFEILEKYSEGLIVLSGGLKGSITSFLIQDQENLAVDTLKALKAIYGEKNFFLELQDSRLSPQMRANERLKELAREYSLGVVATCDVHYLDSKEAFAHEIWMMVEQKMTLEENPRSSLVSTDYYLKTPEEMAEAFQDVPEALSNTVEIANRCNVKLSFKDETGKRIYHLPTFAAQGQTQEELFIQLSREGLEARLLKDKINEPSQVEEYKKRLEYEVEVICKMGFAGYYLIVSDFIRWAKRNKIPVGPGRGSGAGSLVAWVLDIIDLNPIENKLVFERFLNPERVSLPDFDIDFCQARRHEVIEYVTKKYGQEQVCQIVTFAKEQSKNAIKDVGRVMGMSFAESNRLTKLIPSVQAKPLTIDESLEQVEELKGLYQDDSRIRQVIDISKSLEGALRQPGVHAAGVIISGKPIADLTPMSRDVNGNLITQWDMKMSEEAGLVKFDFLGLVTLDLLDLACEIIRKRPEPELQGLFYDTIPIHDKRIYELISNGDTMGVFQLESSGMQNLCTRIKPDCFEDIAAINALFRPGPLESGMVDDYINRKHGREKVTVAFPEMEEILRETYGVILYQEQVMEIARSVAGYTLGGADLLRRAMGKKIHAEMEAQRQVFVTGAEANNKDPKKASELFDLIQKFAGYGFNKSHAAAYAKLAVQSAYLKALYPTEFFTALLTIEKENTDKLARYILDARKRGLKILTPDVNESDINFSNVDEKSIRFGLSAIKNVGEAAVESILESRKKIGRFEDLFHFVSNVDLRKVNRRTLESLIQAGAMDSLENIPKEELRSRYLATLDVAIEWASREAEHKSVGQFSLFGEETGAPGTSSASKPSYQYGQNLNSRELLDWEKTLLGIYLSASPLDAFEDRISKTEAKPIFALAEMAPKSKVCIAALVAELREVRIKRGRRVGEMMGIVRLEDQSGQIELVSFPDHFKEFANHFRSKEALLIYAELDFEEDKPKLLGGEIKHNNSLSVLNLKDLAETWPKKIQVKLDVEKIETLPNPSFLFGNLSALLLKHPGPVPVELVLVKRGRFETSLDADQSFAVRPDKLLLEELTRVTSVPDCLSAQAIY
jgi:DNA polymerase-3 subunit alpha